MLIWVRRRLLRSLLSRSSRLRADIFDVVVDINEERQRIWNKVHKDNLQDDCLFDVQEQRQLDDDKENSNHCFYRASPNINTILILMDSDNGLQVAVLHSYKATSVSEFQIHDLTINQKISPFYVAFSPIYIPVGPGGYLILSSPWWKGSTPP